MAYRWHALVLIISVDSLMKLQEMNEDFELDKGHITLQHYSHSVAKMLLKPDNIHHLILLQ